MGESVAAVVALKEGERSDEDEIVEFCRARLGGYKIPRRVIFMKELPKSSSGKILKRVLREGYWKDEDIKV